MFSAQDLPLDPESFLVERFGFAVLTHILAQKGQVSEALGGGRLVQRLIEAQGAGRIFWHKNLLPDPERFLLERLGFGVVPYLLEKEPEVIQGVDGLGLFRSPNALCHCNRSFRNSESPPDIFLVQSVG